MSLSAPTETCGSTVGRWLSGEVASDGGDGKSGSHAPRPFDLFLWVDIDEAMAAGVVVHHHPTHASSRGGGGGRYAPSRGLLCDGIDGSGLLPASLIVLTIVLKEGAAIDLLQARAASRVHEASPKRCTRHVPKAMHASSAWDARTHALEIATIAFARAWPLAADSLLTRPTPCSCAPGTATGDATGNATGRLVSSSDSSRKLRTSSSARCLVARPPRSPPGSYSLRKITRVYV